MSFHPHSPDFRAKSVPNLTDIVVQKLPEGLHFDIKVKNFGMRVGKSRKTWIVVKGENRTKITLGRRVPIRNRKTVSFDRSACAFMP